jgi:hypothetical protein
MSTVDIDSLKEQVSRMIIECRSQDGQIDEWGERELRDDFLALLATQRTHLKAELLAKMPKKRDGTQAHEDDTYGAEDDGYNQALGEITKLVEEL